MKPMRRHDLDEMRNLFKAVLGKAKSACEELKEARERLKLDAETCEFPRDAERMRGIWKDYAVKIAPWEDAERELCERLPARLSPYVRRDLFEERGFANRMRITIREGNKLKDASRVKQVLDLFEAIFGEKPCFGVHEFSRAAEIFALDVAWPEFDAIESEAVSAYKGYLREAKTHPELFELWPRKTDAIVEAVVEILTPLEKSLRQRLEKDWPENDPLHSGMLFSNDQLSRGKEAPPRFGTNLDGLCVALQYRWPMLRQTSILEALSIAFEGGLIRAVVSDPTVAVAEGYTAAGTDQISSSEQLDRWFRESQTNRPFSITFRIASRATGQPAPLSLPAMAQTPPPGTNSAMLPIVVDRATETATWSGERIPMKAGADFKMLACLAESANHAASYRDLMIEAFPDSYYGNIELTEAPESVRVGMTRIRRAFKEVGCPWQIKSIKGTGYRLTLPKQ